MELLVIGFGSNLGRREENLRRARLEIESLWSDPCFSSVYETLPWGVAEQPLFLNQVGMGMTELPPLSVLAALKQTEERMGRQPGPRNGPRLIDLDILYYGSWVFTSQKLNIPHPRLHERAFTLVPLTELLPDWIHPLRRMTNKQLLEALNPEPKACRFYAPAQ